MGTAKKAIYLIFMVLIANLRLTAQENNVTNGDLGYITAYTDNHYPKLNELVTITLKAYISYEYDKYFDINSQNKNSHRWTIDFYLAPNDGVEIISGKRMHGKCIEKKENIEMTTTVRFTKRKYVRIIARLSQYGFEGYSWHIDIPFYVGGAYYESTQVQFIKVSINKMMKNIYKYKVGGVPPTTYDYRKNNYRDGGITVAPDIGKNHTFRRLTEYQLSVKDKALEWNIKKYEELRKKYDALVYLIRTWRYVKEGEHSKKSRERYLIRRKRYGWKGGPPYIYTEFLKDYNNLYNKNGNNTNKHPIINKYKELLEGRRPAFHGCFW